MPVAPLTHAEKAKVRRYLGYSLLYAHVDPMLEGQLVALNSLPDDGETLNVVRDILAKLDDVFLHLNDGRDLDDISHADEAGVDAWRGFAARCRRGRVWVTQLSQALNMPVRGDCFGVPRIDKRAPARFGA